MENGNESQHLQSSPTSNLPQLRRFMCTPSNWCEQKRSDYLEYFSRFVVTASPTTWNTVLLYAQHEYPLESTQDTRTCCYDSNRATVIVKVVTTTATPTRVITIVETLRVPKKNNSNDERRNPYHFIFFRMCWKYWHINHYFYIHSSVMKLIILNY